MGKISRPENIGSDQSMVALNQRLREPSRSSVGFSDVQRVRETSRRGFMSQFGLATLAVMAGVVGIKKITDYLPPEGDHQKSALSLDEAAKTLEVDILLPGGADHARWGIGYMGATTDAETSGPLKAPPLNNPGVPPMFPAQPPGFLLVPDGSGGNVHVLKKWGKQMLVIRSDHGTNNHDEGKQASATGEKRIMMPSTPVLRAKMMRPASSLSYLAGSGQDFRGGLNVGSMNISDIGGFYKVAYPHLADPLNPKKSDHIFPPPVVDDLWARRMDDVSSTLDGNFLPDIQAIAAARMTAQDAGDDILDFLSGLEGIDIKSNNLTTAVKVAIALFKKGDLAGVSLQHNAGYDTHNQANGQQQMPNFDNLWKMVDQILTYAKEQGIKIRLVIKTDFGRRPAGMGNGGDISAHWPIGETVFVGDGIEGPRLVGVLDDNQNLVGEKSKVGDVILFQRGLNGLETLKTVEDGDKKVPVALSDTATTGPNKIADLIKAQG